MHILGGKWFISIHLLVLLETASPLKPCPWSCGLGGGSLPGSGMGHATQALESQSTARPLPQRLVLWWASEKQRNCCWKFWKRLKLNLETRRANLLQPPSNYEGKSANTGEAEWGMEREKAVEQAIPEACRSLHFSKHEPIHFLFA